MYCNDVMRFFSAISNFGSSLLAMRLAIEGPKGGLLKYTICPGLKDATACACDYNLSHISLAPPDAFVNSLANFHDAMKEVICQNFWVELLVCLILDICLVIKQ